MSVAAHPRGDLNHNSWCDFVEDIGATGLDPRSVDGSAPAESAQRRWSRCLGPARSLELADVAQLLSSLDLSLSDYFLHCQINGLRPWRVGVPPSWRESNWWWVKFE